MRGPQLRQLPLTSRPTPAVMIAVLCNDTGAVGLPDALAVLASGGSALDAVEAGIRPVEADPTVTSVGLGGWPNALGQMELDAGIMDGDSLAVGAVGALPGALHAISVARQVLERLPHVFLAGPGAARFAAECGLAADTPLAEPAAREWRAWLQRALSDEDRGRWPDVPLARYARWAADPERTGTTVWMVLDAAGRLAAGASTCGWAYKYPGRLGDSCVPGAGFYADSRYGAAACTGAGELTIRAGTARSIVASLRLGQDVRQAVQAAAEDLRGLQRTFDGGVTLHALDPQGNAAVLSIGLDRPWHYRHWRQGDREPRAAAARLEPWASTTPST